MDHRALAECDRFAAAGHVHCNVESVLPSFEAVCVAAESIMPLDHEHALPGTAEPRRRREATHAAPDDDDVVRTLSLLLVRARTSRGLDRIRNESRSEEGSERERAEPGSTHVAHVPDPAELGIPREVRRVAPRLDLLVDGPLARRDRAADERCEEPGRRERCCEREAI